MYKLTGGHVKHGEISLNLVWIVITIFLLTQHQTEFCQVLYQSEEYLAPKRNSIWWEINQKSITTIEIWFDLKRLRKNCQCVAGLVETRKDRRRVVVLCRVLFGD